MRYYKGKKQIIGLLLLLSIVGCGAGKSEDVAIDDEVFDYFVAAGDILEKYDVQEEHALTDFNGFMFGETEVELVKQLKEQGFVVDTRTPPYYNEDNNTKMSYWLGQYQGIAIEPAFFFQDNRLGQVVFAIDLGDKRQFMAIFAKMYGRPIYDELQSNSYIWYFTNGHLIYNDRFDYGLVEFVNEDYLVP